VDGVHELLPQLIQVISNPSESPTSVKTGL
jgi:hypothetical protein